VAGVAQGSPISPLCFSLFIDDMTEVLEFPKYHMYADDLQIYQSRRRDMLFECIREVNSDLSKVFEWSLPNSLKLNPLKSMVLPIYRNHLLGPLPALFLSDDFTPYVFKVKNLGVTFSYDFNSGDHVSTICRKFYGALAGLRRLADVTPFAVRIRLVVVLVIPFFIYYDCLSFALDSYSLRELTVALNACVRYVYRRRLFDRISDVFDSILGCSLLTYMEFRLACLMFSLVTGGRPRYLYDSLVYSRSERTLRIN
jgi:hypothetical protein